MPRLYHALLLKKVSYGDKHLILQTYTQEEGTLSFFTDKQESLKRKHRIPLMPLCLLEITTGFKSVKGIQRIREMNSIRNRSEISGDVYKSAMVMFINELLIKTVGTYQGDGKFFEFVNSALDDLCQSEENYRNFHLKFMVELAGLLGFYPHDQKSEEDCYFDLYEGSFCNTLPGHSYFISPELAGAYNKLLLAEGNLVTLDISNDERRILLNHLLDYYRIHMEHFGELKSQEVLEATFA